MNDEEMVNRLLRTADRPTPSAEATTLAVKLSGHTHCQLALQCKFDALAGHQVTPCDGCLGDAATIDHELQLPQRNAALLLAQGVVDAGVPYGHKLPLPEPACDCNVCSAIDELREALKAIR